jgi:hypothetical protein
MTPWLTGSYHPRFSRANGGLADLSAFVGLPLVGIREKEIWGSGVPLSSEPPGLPPDRLI